MTASVKTEAGLQELNNYLTTKSFLSDGAEPSALDYEKFSEIQGLVNKEMYPHVFRWHRYMKHLKTTFPLRKLGTQAQQGSKGGGGSKGGDAKAGDGKGKDQAQLEGKLIGAEMGKVVTRFPPEPSGYLHIGHAKAAMLNNYYARQYKGKLILRFDDTNPSKEKMEFEESIIKDLGTLQIYPDHVSHTSDHFELLQTKMTEVIKAGKAYCDDTEMLQMRAERDAGTESKCRKQSVEKNLELWAEMLKGSELGQKYCVRGMMDMQCKNKCLRDPVFYRCKVDVPHHQHGFKYKAYPTYDFACPVVDAHEGVTHALRTIEYKDRDEMYTWVTEATKSKKVELIEFSKTQFQYTILSKRKLLMFVENGHVSGWDDPRFPTVQGIMRRGMTVDGLMEFMMTQGASKATNLMEWDKIWAINKQKIDLVVPRYPAVGTPGAVTLTLSDGPKEPVGKIEKRHPKNDELGERLIMLSKEILLEQEDAAEIAEGEQVTLLHWGNAYVDKIQKDKSGKVVSMTGHLNLEGNVKDTKKKLHWIPNLVDQCTPCVLRELDHLVMKPKIEDDDDLTSLINPNSMVDSLALGDPLLKTLQKGDKIQLERRGYFIVDQPATLPRGTKMILIKIPDGKTKDVSSVGGSGKGAAAAPGNAAAAPKAKAKAEAAPAKTEAPAKEAKGKAKAKAAPEKVADRPVEDITRLNIRVGKITKVWEHPDADKLYCEEIDLGEGTGPRTIASGLREHVKKENMEGKLVLVLANLKPRKMQGFESQGMVLCATDPKSGKVELLEPPAGSIVGERVVIDGVEMLDADDKLNEKTGKNPLVAVKDGMRTTAGKVASYQGAAWKTSGGNVVAPTVKDGQIS